MKFNITTEDAKFIVNEQKRIVVCVIEDTKQLFNAFAQSNFRISTDCDATYNFIHGINKDESALEQRMVMPGKFVGVARCGEDDEWDEDIGRTIAFSRAKDALLQSFWRRAQTYFTTVYKWIEEAADMMDKIGEKFSVNMKKRHAYIEELVGVAPEEE